MEKIAIYGKGGIGKSFIATSLSAYYALRGKKVLHVGCDPKTDSSVRLMDNHIPFRTVLEVLADDPTVTSTEKIMSTGRLGIECCESGGPSPGQGCGGRGVAKTLEFLEETGVFLTDKYDVTIFDVLGDVVCGGFAAPLRLGFAEKVFIVTSEEPMALFAANNICKAIHTYAANGIVLGGIVANLKDNHADRKFLNNFAERLKTHVLAFIPRDALVQEAEKRRKTIVEEYATSLVAQTIKDLAERIISLDVKTIDLPEPFTEEAFFDFIKNGR